MKISELMHNLRQIKKQYGDLECIYSIDDEGNDFHEVHYHPTPMVKKDNYYTQDTAKPKLVCIN